jgi:hypothetical protein
MPTDILELDRQLNALIIQRKTRDAFLNFYDENVVAQENGMGALRIVQVAVRRWKNGQVVRERFYHKECVSKWGDLFAQEPRPTHEAARFRLDSARGRARGAAAPRVRSPQCRWAACPNPRHG